MSYSIAIDGPAASGKSTAAKIIAKRLKFLYVDTGAMYRAVTLLMLEKGLDTKDSKQAESILEECHIREDREGRIYLNDRDVTSRVRENDVSSQVSYACAHKCVRERLVALQQEMAKSENVIMDGRDIGTVVLKDATLKVFQIASVQARAERRYLENKAKGIAVESLEQIKEDIERRDYIDSHRENSPLMKASDAIEVDTSDMTIEEEVDVIIHLFRERIGETSWNNLVQSL
ncbi:MAG: (d)CMP kinase [Bacilli bacterium]|jgi:cytidylate kinase|nr:(d)CMP kinase [Bacilli bacterium]